MREKFRFNPEAVIGGMGPPEDRPPPPPEPPGIFPCPCCGYLTFPVPKEEAIAFICPVCFWENDVFISSDDEPSDENHGMTLNQGRKNYQKYGAMREDFIKHVRPPLPSEIPAEPAGRRETKDEGL